MLPNLLSEGAKEVPKSRKSQRWIMISNWLAKSLSMAMELRLWEIAVTRNGRHSKEPTEILNSLLRIQEERYFCMLQCGGVV